MNPLVKKEIRLLLPGFLAILALEILLPWLLKDIDMDQVFFSVPVVLFLGMILLATDTFGREFSLSTFQSMMSQPVERRQIWWSKITVLLVASVLILAACFLSCGLRLHEVVANVNSIWHGKPGIIGSNFHNSMMASVALILVAASGGLWTSLLFRQTAAAFWITLLAPLALQTLIAFLIPKLLPHSISDVVVYGVLYGAAGIYSLGGFWLARRLFYRAQETAWTGGVINISRWRYFENGKQATCFVRRRRPLAALLKKEFQLHSVCLICAGVLLALQIVAFFVRADYGRSDKSSLIYGLTTVIWIFWLIIPLILGCTAVAEERKLGVADGQFCQPVSRRRQFGLKLIPVLILGTLVGGVMPLLMEGIAAHLGAPNELFSALAQVSSHGYDTLGQGLPAIQISVIALSAAFACLGFFASTLTKNFLQALGLTIFVSVVCVILALSKELAPVTNASIFGITLWHSALPILIAILAVPMALLWLAWLNFSHYREGWRLWRRNVLGLVGALAFVAVSSAATYNRVWEVFEPPEPPHGAAVFSSANRPVLSSDGYYGLRVRLSDGRIWFDSLGYPTFLHYRPNFWRQLWWLSFHPLPVSAGPQQFMGGSNWVSATTRHLEFLDPSKSNPKHIITGYWDTVGIKTNGTLWISSEAKPVVWTGANMVRYGNEDDWKQVSHFQQGLLLLKKDGTLWQWGTNGLQGRDWRASWPTVRKSQMQPFGTNSDWQELFGSWSYPFAKTKDGAVWSALNWSGRVERKSNLDNVVPQTFCAYGPGPIMAYVGKDGTLWVCAGTGDQFFQVGKETDWMSVMINWGRLVALKSDGSLWQWQWDGDQEFLSEVMKKPPTRLGIHNDWIGLTSTWDGAYPVSLAADGSLWLWPSPNAYFLLKPPKQPEFLGNVFGKGY